MEVDDLYGFMDDDLEAARLAVEQALNVQLEPHESLHMGGDYYARGLVGDEEELILQRNFDEEGEVIEDEFSDIPVLLYVNTIRSIERAQELEQTLVTKIPRLRLLRRGL